MASSPPLYSYPPKPVAWNQRDVLLFANTIGCTADELHYLYELHPKFSVFPTYPITLTFKHDYTSTTDFKRHFTRHLTPPANFIPGFPRLDVEKVVDGERSLEILQSLPTTSAGRNFSINSFVIGVWGKGPNKATIVKTEHLIVESERAASGVGGKREEKQFARMSEVAIFLGQGGWGGPNDPTLKDSWKMPTTPPTTRVTHSISPTAHLLYRLNGDYNPLHATFVSASVVQPTPIMHGLYSWNVAAHAVLKEFAGSDPKALKSFRASFKAPVRPGDVLEIEMWNVGAGEVVFVVKVGGRVVLGGGRAVLAGRGERGRL